MNQLRVLIVGDSNCLPRREGKYEDSWIYRLKQANPTADFIVLADGSRTTEYLATHPRKRPDGSIEYDPSSLETYDPTVVILNLGIVDCAPRLFSKIESQVISRLPEILRAGIIAAAKRFRRRRVTRVYVSHAAFEANVHQYLARCSASGVKRVIIIGIPTPDSRGVSKNALLPQAVAAYNATWARLASGRAGVTFLDPLHPEQPVSRLYEADGYHLSPYGHGAVFRAIEEALGSNPTRLEG